MTLDAELDETPMHWSVEGDAVFVAIDTNPLYGTRPALSLLAVGTAGLLWWLAWSGYNRLTQKRLLEHPFRQQILRLVQEHQRIRQHELQTLIPGITRATLTYHADKLVKAKLMTRTSKKRQGSPQWLSMPLA